MDKFSLILETDRLKIVPLTYQQLIIYLKAKDVFETEFALAVTGRIISEDVKDMVESFTLPKMKRAGQDNYLYFTFWVAINKLTNTIVAELGFKGPPDRNGDVEIGYGTMPGHRGSGYMTEAVSAMLVWALSREGVRGVLAEVDETNLASLRVVEKNGFKQFDKRGKMTWWRKTLSSMP
jgi:ribosomal-protein-alanine N-acetyltransferase